MHTPRHGTPRPPRRLVAIGALLLSVAGATCSVVTSAEDAPAAGDATAGRRAFNRSCRACHQVEAGAGSELGPNLAGVVGRTAGADAAASYSDALKQAAAGVVWDAPTLERFLEAPARMIPGTKMPMAIADATQRRDLVAYLSTLAP